MKEGEVRHKMNFDGTVHTTYRSAAGTCGWTAPVGKSAYEMELMRRQFLARRKKNTHDE